MIHVGSLLLSCMIRLLMMNRRRRSVKVPCHFAWRLTLVIEDKPEEKAEEEKLEKKSKVHKSLAEILGIQKKGEPSEQPKVAVVIDPKIARVLRPHQIEGVKVVLC